MGELLKAVFVFSVVLLFAVGAYFVSRGPFERSAQAQRVNLIIHKLEYPQNER